MGLLVFWLLYGSGFLTTIGVFILLQRGDRKPPTDEFGVPIGPVENGFLVLLISALRPILPPILSVVGLAWCVGRLCNNRGEE